MAFPLLAVSQGLTRGEVFDFEPGDMFQSRFHAYGLSPTGPPTYWTDSVLSKTWSMGWDTVSYTIHRHTYTPPAGPGLPPFTHDTLITRAYGDLTSLAGHFQLPWPCLPILDSLGSDAALCGQEVWVQYVAGDTCFESDTWTTTLVRGCGGPYYWRLQPAGPYHMVHELVYYHKNGVGCGELLTSVGDPHGEIRLPITLHPNPGTIFQLTGIGHRPALMRLLDMQGRTMRKGIPVTEYAPVDVGDLRPGTYLLELRLADGRREVLRWVRE
ncbi:MAG: T9SS type A sorting domain-containing protein [Flavobacteriales bacterium]|nr:T9SS type A sorting domain-containing protein [Flavobacteriales bacterium]